MSKKRKIAIVVVSILLIVFILIILLFISPKDELNLDDYPSSKVYIIRGQKNPDEKTVTNKNLKKEQCVNNICVKNVIITINGNISQITYKITNKGDEPSFGYLKMVFNGDDKQFLIYDLQAGETKDGQIGVHGRDLSKYKKYELQELLDTDYAVFAN